MKVILHLILNFQFSFLGKVSDGAVLFYSVGGGRLRGQPPQTPFLPESTLQCGWRETEGAALSNPLFSQNCKAPKNLAYGANYATEIELSILAIPA
jgi:hypothetical protein